MSDATDTDEQPAALPGDGLREGIIDDLRRRIGDAIVDTHISPNDDLWIRVQTDAWRQTAEALKAAGFTFFSFISGLDWMPSPYGKGEEDPTAEQKEPDTEIRQGVTGGDTRFQVFARLVDLDRHVGVTIKADVPDDRSPSIRGPRCSPAPTGTSASATRCSASASTAIPTSATCTCPPTSRATPSARTSRCSPA